MLDVDNNNLYFEPFQIKKLQDNPDKNQKKQGPYGDQDAFHRRMDEMFASFGIPQIPSRAQQGNMRTLQVHISFPKKQGENQPTPPDDPDQSK